MKMKITIRKRTKTEEMSGKLSTAAVTVDITLGLAQTLNVVLSIPYEEYDSYEEPGKMLEAEI